MSTKPSKNSDMMSKYKSSSTTKYSNTFDESILNNREVARTSVLALNIILGGVIASGLGSGLTMIAGPSKHFKSNISLMLVAAYLKLHPDAICIFYDTEYGITPEYLKAFKIDPKRVLHTPIDDIEEIKHDMATQLNQMDGKDKIVFLIDSLGNIASRKEIDDAEKGDAKADMTRAKQLKSFTRIVSGKLMKRDVPCIAVNHTYETQEMFSKQVMGGGTGLTYNSNTIIFVGRRTQKEGKEVTGYEFILNVEKSRFVKEKSKIGLMVSFDGGINPYSGLLDLAVELGYVVKPMNGWYCRAFLNESSGEMVTEEHKHRAKDTDNMKFWGDLLKHKPFTEAVGNKYQLKAVTTEEIDLSDE
jgi:RecA/RadA recombinase